MQTAGQKMCACNSAFAGTTRRLPSALPFARKASDIRDFRLPYRRWRARKTRRRGGLGDAVAVNKDLAGRHVRMIGSLAHGQNRREADVAALHDRAPLVAGSGLEDVYQLLFQCGPCLAIHLMIEIGVREARMLMQQRVELRLDRTNRNEFAAGAFVDAVEVRAAVEEIALALLGPSAPGPPVEAHRHQRT